MLNLENTLVFIFVYAQTGAKRVAPSPSSLIRKGVQHLILSWFIFLQWRTPPFAQSQAPVAMGWSPLVQWQAILFSNLEWPWLRYSLRRNASSRVFHSALPYTEELLSHGFLARCRVLLRGLLCLLASPGRSNPAALEKNIDTLIKCVISVPLLLYPIRCYFIPSLESLASNCPRYSCAIASFSWGATDAKIRL